MTIFTAPNLLNSARWNNMRIGLLGGSFNPPHKGHVHISLAALHGLQLDAIWWMVTPQNPLKADTPPLPMEERMALSKELITDPRIIVTDIESALGTTITYQTIRKLKKRFPKTDFIWVTGMDNALTLHKWNNWKDLLSEISMAHLTRAPSISLIKTCPLRMLAHQKHVVIDKGARPPLDSGTTYWLLQKKMVDASSTELRDKTP